MAAIWDYGCDVYTLGGSRGKSIKPFSLLKSTVKHVYIVHTLIKLTVLSSYSICMFSYDFLSFHLIDAKPELTKHKTEQDSLKCLKGDSLLLKQEVRVGRTEWPLPLFICTEIIRNMCIVVVNL